MMTDLLTGDFDYALPPDLIAQNPAAQRDGSRLLVLDRATGETKHTHFSSIGDYLSPGDLLVMNRTRVIPARLSARKESGGEVELLLVQRHNAHEWTALARPSHRLRVGMTLALVPGPLRATLTQRDDEGRWRISFNGSTDVDDALRAAGTLPLPPYIRASTAPASRYQTVYADREGSVAAPTAGLHFSEDLLLRLQAQGIRQARVTLHVGLGTFRPVTAERVVDHQLHAEWGDIPPEVADLVNKTRASGRRIVAVGTTSTRLLETATEQGKTHPFTGDTDRFIYPGYRFQAIDALVTNFHLPRSTLLMLVSAFAGRESVLRAYQEAVDLKYRFFSFGDAMLVV